MKQITQLSVRLMVLTSFVLAASSCQKPSDRVAEPDKKIAAGLVALSDLGQVVDDVEKKSDAAPSAEAPPAAPPAPPAPGQPAPAPAPAPKAVERVVYISDVNAAAFDDVKKLDDSLAPKKISGKVDMLIKKVVIGKNKAELDKQLKEGAIALVVLKDEVKILKVTRDIYFNGENMDKLKSLKYMKVMSQMQKARDAQQNSALAGELSKLSSKQPADLQEKFGLVEISSIKITKMGKLENQRTDYGEKRSVLDITPTSLAEATHIVLGDEVGARPSGE